MSRRTKKATNLQLTSDYLKSRAENCTKKGYPVPKWITFCEALLAKHYELYLYEARETYSKYITIVCGKRSFKVRFSNHKPIKAREQSGDCDFFVGVTNFTVTNTDMALKAVLQHFNSRNPHRETPRNN